MLARLRLDWLARSTVARRALAGADSVALATSELIAQPADDLGDLQDLCGRLVQVFSRCRDGFAPSGLKPQARRRNQETGSRQILVELMRQGGDQSLNASDCPFAKILAARALHATLPTLERSDLAPQSPGRLVEWLGLNSELLNQALTMPYRRLVPSMLRLVFAVSDAVWSPLSRLTPSGSLWGPPRRCNHISKLGPSPRVVQ